MAAVICPIEAREGRRLQLKVRSVKRRPKSSGVLRTCFEEEQRKYSMARYLRREDSVEAGLWDNVRVFLG